MTGGQTIHVLWTFILMIIILEGIVDSATYRSRRTYVSTGLDTWMIVMIVVSCLSMLAVPFVIILCIKCGCCKVKQRTFPGQTAVPLGQQYGQPGTTMYGQPQSGMPPQYGQPLQYGQPSQYGQTNPFGQQSSYGQPNGFGQQSAFGQPDENQFSYSSQKY
ncbi:uncharacterized protein LOC134272042 isoform X1 [Saccostrea cucullata]|uniref:uncharacterized protein LOC134272042 isoform X1 n=1 Tax=Saccostrea cuccullata TaxID=36930 RepID=UPI002ED0270D